MVHLRGYGSSWQPLARILLGCLLVAAPVMTSCNAHQKDPVIVIGSDSRLRPDTLPNPQLLLHAASVSHQKVPDGYITSIESLIIDAESWEVHLLTPADEEKIVKTDTDGVQILVGPPQPLTSSTDTPLHYNQLDQVHLDYQQAVTHLLAIVHDGSITKLALSLNSTTGIPTWQADVWDTNLVQHKISLNAQSGAVISDVKVGVTIPNLPPDPPPLPPTGSTPSTILT